MKTVCGLLVLVLAGALAAAEVVEPFNGKNLDGWKAKGGGGTNAWCVGAAKPDPAAPAKFVVDPNGNELINNSPGHGKSLDFYCAALHGDAIITLEVMVPKGSNSGIYVMGEYEVQVLDSFGRDAKPGNGDMGAIYSAQPPYRPAYRAPGEWNTYEIWWQAPRFDDKGAKTANARFVKVVLNGRIVHSNVEMRGPTPGGVDGKEKARGPLMFQGNHGPVAYRNIKIAPLPPVVTWDSYGGYFVSNKFEPDAPRSFAIARDQAAFEKLFGVAMVMGDRSHRLAPDAFAKQVVLTSIQRGKAFVEYKVGSTSVEDGKLVLDYRADGQPNATAEYSCPLIVSVPRGEWGAVRFVENGKLVKELAARQ
jgi:hypothetical protein